MLKCERTLVLTIENGNTCLICYAAWFSKGIATNIQWKS